MKAITVLGTISGDELGCTLMHEHLVFDFGCCREEPRTAAEREMARQAVNVEILGALRFNPLVVPDNLVQRQVDLAIKELAPYAEAGGRTIVDVTNVTIGRDPLALQAIARGSGLNIIMGAGYYTHTSMDDRFDDCSINDVAAEIVSDIVDGAGETGVRAGLIGEIGTSSPITSREEKSLRASTRAQRETGAPLMVHPFPWGREGHRILDIIEEEGGNLQRTILCHMNASWFDLRYQTRLADRGAVLEYDMLGINHFYPPNMAAPGEIPALEAVANLIGIGYLDRLLLSQDVFLKMMLCAYGGHGYAHILANLAPLFQAAGVTAEHLDVMLVKNPARLLAFL